MNGWYTSMGDSPDGTLWAGFVTNDPNTGFIVQRVWRMHNNIMRECIRYFYAGTYLDWEYVNPPMIVGVEYRTTERWDGKPVYTKLIDCGVMPNNTGKFVDIGENVKAKEITAIAVKSGDSVVQMPWLNESDGSLLARVTVLNGRNIYILTKSDLSEYTLSVKLKYTK
jgi:hypothetical protein